MSARPEQDRALRLDRRRAERERDEWAAQRGLKESHASTDPVPWLLGKRTREGYGRRPSWMDHGTRWTRDGKPYCLVGQPYDLSTEDMRELIQLEDEHGLRVSLSSDPCWHYPGEVLGVVVRVAGEADG
jgi:hypothetical protein